jgi:hypothetical protein
LWLRVLAKCLGGSSIFGQYTCTLTNNAHKLTSYRFGFKCETNRIRKYFLSELRFKTRSLGRTTDATPLLFTIKEVQIAFDNKNWSFNLKQMV